MDWVGYIIWCSLCVLGDVWVGVTQAKDVDFSNQIWLSSSSSTQLSIIYNHTADSNPIIINHNHNHNKSIEQLGLPLCNLHTHPTTPNQIYKPTTLKQTLKYSKRSAMRPTGTQLSKGIQASPRYSLTDPYRGCDCSMIILCQIDTPALSLF